jgi:hypothetical protein
MTAGDGGLMEAENQYEIIIALISDILSEARISHLLM